MSTSSRASSAQSSSNSLTATTSLPPHPITPRPTFPLGFARTNHCFTADRTIRANDARRTPVLLAAADDDGLDFDELADFGDHADANVDDTLVRHMHRNRRHRTQSPGARRTQSAARRFQSPTGRIPLPTPKPTPARPPRSSTPAADHHHGFPNHRLRSPQQSESGNHYGDDMGDGFDDVANGVEDVTFEPNYNHTPNNPLHFDQNTTPASSYSKTSCLPNTFRFGTSSSDPNPSITVNSMIFGEQQSIQQQQQHQPPQSDRQSPLQNGCTGSATELHKSFENLLNQHYQGVTQQLQQLPTSADFQSAGAVLDERHEQIRRDVQSIVQQMQFLRDSGAVQDERHDQTRKDLRDIAQQNENLADNMQGIAQQNENLVDNIFRHHEYTNQQIEDLAVATGHACRHTIDQTVHLRLQHRQLRAQLRQSSIQARNQMQSMDRRQTQVLDRQRDDILTQLQTNQAILIERIFGIRLPPPPPPGSFSDDTSVRLIVNALREDMTNARMASERRFSGLDEGIRGLRRALQQAYAQAQAQPHNHVHVPVASPITGASGGGAVLARATTTIIDVDELATQLGDSLNLDDAKSEIRQLHSELIRQIEQMRVNNDALRLSTTTNNGTTSNSSSNPGQTHEQQTIPCAIFQEAIQTATANLADQLNGLQNTLLAAVREGNVEVLKRVREALGFGPVGIRHQSKRQLERRNDELVGEQRGDGEVEVEIKGSQESRALRVVKELLTRSLAEAGRERPCSSTIDDSGASSIPITPEVEGEPQPQTQTTFHSILHPPNEDDTFTTLPTYITRAQIRHEAATQHLFCQRQKIMHVMGEVARTIAAFAAVLGPEVGGQIASVCGLWDVFSEVSGDLSTYGHWVQGVLGEVSGRVEVKDRNLELWKERVGVLEGELAESQLGEAQWRGTVVNKLEGQLLERRAVVSGVLRSVLEAFRRCNKDSGDEIAENKGWDENRERTGDSGNGNNRNEYEDVERGVDLHIPQGLARQVRESGLMDLDLRLDDVDMDLCA